MFVEKQGKLNNSSLRNEDIIGIDQATFAWKLLFLILFIIFLEDFFFQPYVMTIHEEYLIL